MTTGKSGTPPPAKSVTPGEKAPARAGASVPAAAGLKPSISLVEESVPRLVAAEFKKKDLIDSVVALSGLKKKDVKPVVEATLRALGDAIGEGRDANLQPLGKFKVTRIKSQPNGKVLNVRIRQSLPSVADLDSVQSEVKEALAESDE